jgi:hypothetical protein
MSDYNDNFAIRPEDFRKSWPHALAIASEELFETVQVLKTTQEQIYMLVRTTPAMLKIAQNHVMDSSKRGIDAIQAAHAQVTQAQKEIEKVQEDFLKTVKIQRIAAETACSVAKEIQTEARLCLLKLQSEKTKFNAEKLEFSSLSLFKRIFYNVMIP